MALLAVSGGPPVSVRVLYRLVLTNPPTRRDFLSDAAQGKPLRGGDPLAQHVWSGISVYQTEAQARRKARTYPWLGGYIAALAIPVGAAIRIERTFPRSVGHHTVWGDAGALLAYVARVVPV